MSISKEQVKHIAKLARLKLNDEELESYTKELSSILDYIEKLNELDTANVEPLTHPIENNNVFREDELEDSVSREDALKMHLKKMANILKYQK